jgi:peptidoglycan hydrolase-like protein with peptidoglycan-binding domain/DNA invertase Pin-like site-specific DNA recombinase
MRRTHSLFGARAALLALGAILIVLLALPLTANAQEGPRSQLLAPGAGYADAGSSHDVKSLQRKLRRLGWRPGPVDGLFGPRTAQATANLQRAAGLTPDGIVGPRTTQALESALRSPLRRGAGYAQPNGSPRVRTLQSGLQRLGLKPGPVDGVFGPRTQAAVKRMQRAGGVSADGVVGRPTERLLTQGGSALDKERISTSSRPETAPDQARLEQVRGGSNEEAKTRSNNNNNNNNNGRQLRKPVASEAPVASGTPDRSSSGSTLILILAKAALAVALAGLTGMLLVRLGPGAGGMSVPLVHGLMAEGRSRGRSTGGRFRGLVHAVVLNRRGLGRRQKARYLVSDPNQRKPIWVGENDVASLVAESPEQSQGERSPDTRATPWSQQTLAVVPDEPTTDGVRALGYISVRERETIDAGRPQGQMEAIDALCDRRGWRLLEVVRDREEPRGTALDRPGLGYALERVENGEASCVIVSELLRLSRSVADLGRVLDVIDRTGGRLVALDVDVDTSTPEGRKALEVLVAVSGWERQRLAERTRRGLEAARAKGGGSSRPSVGDVPALNQWIVELRESGLTLQAIADRLNAEGVPTLRGGAKWRPSSVQAAAGYRRPQRQPRVVAGGEAANGKPAANGGGAS